MSWSNNDVTTQAQLGDLLSRVIDKRGTVAAWGAGPGGAVLIKRYEFGLLGCDPDADHVVDGEISGPDLSEQIWEELFPDTCAKPPSLIVGFPDSDYHDQPSIDQQLLTMVTGAENLVAVILKR